MSAPISGNDTKGVLLGRVDRIVEEDDLFGNLHDLGGRTHAWKTLWRALEGGVLVTLVLAEILYFLHEFELIGRKVRALQAILQFALLPFRLSRPLTSALGVPRLAVRGYPSLGDGIAPTRRRPKASEIGTTTGQVRRRCFRRGFHFCRGRLFPRQASAVRICSGEGLIFVEAVA